ncbi:septum formation initiator [Sporanaerobium hydrogeniformans]|uniref:Septum formation initiator n=1 Tax=Sporanaerobium hydrogeniformans TaxID=3072179 RepID=A0AC61DAS7_9FIRM|nr:septum formation initiator family protein [Sporanaerobium hydrogeniformans]PHV70364.1 septum formation initiator [Sporanaerobium hydrogeniformans]
MKKNNRLFYIVVILSTLIVTSLGVKGYQVNNLIKRVERQVEEDKKILQEEQEKLSELQKEVTEIDTPEYIEKVAREQLGMVRKEDIIFKEKQ